MDFCYRGSAYHAVSQCTQAKALKNSQNVSPILQTYSEVPKNIPCLLGQFATTNCRLVQIIRSSSGNLSHKELFGCSAAQSHGLSTSWQAEHPLPIAQERNTIWNQPTNIIKNIQHPDFDLFNSMFAYQNLGFGISKLQNFQSWFLDRFGPRNDLVQNRFLCCKKEEGCLNGLYNWEGQRENVKQWFLDFVIPKWRGLL